MHMQYASNEDLILRSSSFYWFIILSVILRL